jgi:hypothetical protein
VGKLGHRIAQPTLQVNLVGLLLVVDLRQFEGSLTAPGFLCPVRISIYDYYPSYFFYLIVCVAFAGLLLDMSEADSLLHDGSCCFSCGNCQECDVRQVNLFSIRATILTPFV